MARRPQVVARFVWSEQAPVQIAHPLAPVLAGRDAWEGLSLPRLGKGTTRGVYDLGDGTVLKRCEGRDAHRNGYCSCESEGKFWAKIQGRAEAALFAPTYESGECWTRMQKADEVPVPCLDGACPRNMPYGADWFRAMESKIYPVYARDIHPGQFGIFGGSYKLLDYGV